VIRTQQFPAQNYTHTHTLIHNDIDISLGKNWIRILSKGSTKPAEVFRSCFISYRRERGL